MNHHDHPIRRKYIEHQMKKLNCGIDEILRDHTDLLSHGLRSQACLMFYEKYKRYFRIDEIQEEKP